MSGTAAATTPPAAWAGLSEMRILCLVASGDLQQRHSLQDMLSERVRELVEPGAPVPVSQVGFGDPVIIRPEVSTLLVHARVEGADDQRRLIFTIRPFRAGGIENVVLFGAAPRSVAMPAVGPSPALDEALREALREVLPWGQAD